MSDEPRTFIKSNHGGLHNPGCRAIARLKNPKEVSLTPNQIEAKTEGWAVYCCWRRAATRRSHTYEWYQEEE